MNIFVLFCNLVEPWIKAQVAVNALSVGVEGMDVVYVRVMYFLYFGT